MLILSDKLLLDIQLMHTFMPNMIHQPWMVSNIQSLTIAIVFTTQLAVYYIYNVPKMLIFLDFTACI